MLTVPYWLDDHPRPDDLPVSDLPAEADIVVVGGGYTGLNAARELARLGSSVVVVEAGPIGSGASAVNGGQLNYGLKEDARDVIARHGSVLGRALWEASLGAIDLVEQVVKEHGIDCGFRRSGAVELAYRDSDRKRLQKASWWMEANLGFETRVVAGDDMASVVGGEHYRCALLDDAGASIQPASYLFGLARAVAGMGVAIVEHAKATAIESTVFGFRVETTRGSIQTGSVLVATNGYTEPGLVPGLIRRVVPVGSYMIATEPLGADLAERILPGNRVAWTARRLLHYFKRSADDRLLFGGRRNLATGMDPVAGAEALRADMVEVFPELAETEITHSWGGRLALTFDLLPHIGRRDGIWYAAGYSGHGVALATHVGSEAGRIIGGAQPRSPFSEIPAPTRFFYRRRPWFIPAAGLLYRTLDRIGH